MNSEDIKKLKAEIEADLIKKITGRSFNEQGAKGSHINDVFEIYRARLKELYGPFIAYKIWERVRNLSCYAAGALRCDSLTPLNIDKAKHMANTLLQMMVDECAAPIKERIGD